MKKYLAFLLLSSTAFASSGAEAGVPAVVFHQAVNVTILLAILIFILKDKVRAYYTGKRENYLKAAREVAELKRQVEEQAALLKEKIKKLDETADLSAKKAQGDAREYSEKLLNEAREQAEKLRKETEKTVKAEVYRAVETLRADLIDQSIESSRENIQKQIKESDQKRLQSEFVNKISENGALA